jgi:hypothetical protein
VKVRKLTGADCSDTNCPAVFETEHGTVIVQGMHLLKAVANIHVGPGEALIEIPRAIFISALQAITVR